MLTVNSKTYIRLFYLFIDLIVIIFSFNLSYYLRYGNFFYSESAFYFQEYSLLFGFWAAVLIFFLYFYDLYLTDRSLTVPQEGWKVFKCVAFSAAIAGLAVFFLQFNIFSRLVFGYSSILLFSGLWAWRTGKRLFNRHSVLRGYNNTNVLIIGAGRAGKALAVEIENRPYIGVKIVGFLDDGKEGDASGYDILGKTDMLEIFIKKHFIDLVYVTIPSERQCVSKIIDISKKLNVTVNVLADTFEAESIKGRKEGAEVLPGSFVLSRSMKLDYFGQIPLISYFDSKRHGTELMAKRFLDIIGSVLGLMVLLPVFLIIGILIKLGSSGPVFYVSRRCGRKGVEFNFYKFRSMVKDAESQKSDLLSRSEVAGPMFKMKCDPRVTGFGRFLRKYSLDELPQLVNVLKGDMSLVGPRPPTPDEVIQYKMDYMKRLDIRPGITGMSQVRGRSNLSFYKWVKWDIWYIDHWSFWLDFKIIKWTIAAVLKAKGAY